MAHIAALANSGELSRVTAETEYGLIIEFGPGNSILAKLKDGVIMSQGASNRKGYKYRIFVDWGGEYLYYDHDWEGNPDDADEGPQISTEELIEQHSQDIQDWALQAWAKSWQKWYDIYHEGFDKNLNQTGDFTAQEIPDQKEREAWATQGMLLAVWLALLPSVAAVNYDPGARMVVFDSKAPGKDSIASIIEEMLGNMNAFALGEGKDAAQT